MSSREEPNFLRRPVSHAWRQAHEKLERDLKTEAFYHLFTSGVNAKVTETIEDAYLWIDDADLPVKWRAREIVAMPGRLSTFAESRTDRNIFEFRSNYHHFVGDFWFGRAVPYLDRSWRYGRNPRYGTLPYSVALQNVTTFADRYVIPMGKDVVDATFGRDFHSPEFVIAIQNPPQFPFLQDMRSGGDEGAPLNFMSDYTNPT